LFYIFIFIFSFFIILLFVLSFVVNKCVISDTAAAAAPSSQVLPSLPRTPSSYRTSFSRLQPVDIPDVDNGRHSNAAAISPRDADSSDTRKRFRLLFLFSFRMQR